MPFQIAPVRHDPMLPVQDRSTVGGEEEFPRDRVADDGTSFIGPHLSIGDLDGDARLEGDSCAIAEVPAGGVSTVHQRTIRSRRGGPPLGRRLTGEAHEEKDQRNGRAADSTTIYQHHGNR